MTNLAARLNRNDLTDEEILKSYRDSLGRFRTRSLFKELNADGKYPAYFTMKPYDLPGAISMKRKYLEIADPTEYNVAIQLLGSWKHWEKLCELEWFKLELEDWRTELRKKIEADAIRRIGDIARADSASAFGANRYLLENFGPKPGKKSGAGRPTDKYVKAKAVREAVEAKEITEEDAARLGL